MVDKRDLDGTVALVTGAAGDIGGGLTRELATAGCDIVIADIGVSESAADARTCIAIGYGPEYGANESCVANTR